MGENELPGVCQDPNCPHYQQSLEECECEDHRHPAQLAKKNDEENTDLL